MSDEQVDEAMTDAAARRMVRRVALKAHEVAHRGGPPRSSRMMWRVVRYLLDDAFQVVVVTNKKI